jgi:voltage-gated potassium channel Kch
MDASVYKNSIFRKVYSEYFPNFSSKSAEMSTIKFNNSALWDTLLIVSVVFAAFFMPILPPSLQRTTFTVAYTIIYVAAIFSLEKRGKYTLMLFVITILLAWISRMLNLEVLLNISAGVNIIYFFVIVVSLIKEIALAREVTSGVILSSVTGYLLMGIVYSIFIAFIMQIDPAAFTTLETQGSGPGAATYASHSLYFGFVTLASLGYGDIVPLKPYTRSLATWIVISGQFYIAIIVALLVGKFSARQDLKKRE